MFNRKGNSYIEIMVVVAVLLIITLFAIPRYQDLRRDAFRAQITSDSRLIEAYVIEEYFHNGDMPTGSTLLSNNELKDLLDNKKSYLKGELISSADIDSIGGEKYKLNKEEVLKHVNTKLKGSFVYTDKGVIYIDTISNKEDIDIEDLEKMIGPVKQVALGSLHSAAVTESGDLYMWGNNRYGEQGHNNDWYGYQPVKVEGIGEKVASVHLGLHSSAAITENGDLYTWGWNPFSQLGLGVENTGEVRMPTKVESLSNVKQVEFGYNYAIAVTQEGKLYSWGKGFSGELGNGDSTNKTVYEPTEIKIEKASKIDKISAGAQHAAAIDEDGNLYVWGKGNEGELGFETKEGLNVPTRLEIKENGVNIKVKQVSLGDYHSAVLTENGDIYIWGKNDDGQLGLNDTEERITPTKLDGLSNIKEISLGGSYSAILTKDGNIYTWGYAADGRLGYGDVKENSNSTNKQGFFIRTTPKKIQTISNIKQISSGGNHLIAVTKSGDVYAWGNNVYGQAGHEGRNPITAPKKIEFFNEK